MRVRTLTLIITALTAAAAVRAATAEGANWAQFRGPGSRGIGNGTALPVKWSATENVAWKTPLAGKGWSSPIVWGDRVFVTTVINEGESEPPKKGLYFGGERPTPKTEHQWKVLCLDLKTGKQRWERTVARAVPTSSAHVKNSYASETPVTDGSRVYAYFGNVGLFCLDMDGKPVWEQRQEAVPTKNGWGTASSPVLYQGRLYLVNDNEKASYLQALDAKTGKQLWRVDRDEKSNWATPYIWENGQRTEIVTPGSGAVRSYDLDGKLLWSLKGMSDITIATPYAANGLLYVTSGYVGSRLRPIYAIRPGASGDISLGREETSSKYIAWCNWTAAPYNPSTLVDGNRLFVLYDRALLSAFNAADGKPLFDKERIGTDQVPGSGFTSSPWAYGGYVFCLNEDGATFVYRAGDRPELVGVNRLGEDDMCMATPAIAGSRLLIRTATGLYCIALRRT
jgi:outer membrane protein assembly factor BamB